jgi:hypothetical protein
LLIWPKNTYKQKNHSGRKRVEVRSRKREGEEEGVDMFTPPLDQICFSRNDV